MNETLEAAQSNAPLHSILVVDDEEIVLVALRETFRTEGYHVVTCSNAIEALKLLKEESFSVVISDQQMPLITGLEFLAQVKQVQPDATRILITAVLSLSTVIDAINKGEIYRFVVKPWLREDLLATVRNAVQRYELVCKNLILQVTTQAMNEKLARLNKSLAERVAGFSEQNDLLAKSVASLEGNLRESVTLSVRLLEAVHPALTGRARRAAEFCGKAADRLKLSAEQRQVLEVSAWLHDIGLVSAPRDLVERWLASPKNLNATENVKIERHPILGQEMASFSGPLREVGSTIRAHHERFDGKGFPDQLRGEKIPWLARVLAVALACTQSGQDRNSLERMLSRDNDSTFDPTVVRGLIEC